MIKNNKDRTLTVECDFCGEEYDTDATTYEEANKEAKAEGWTKEKLAGHWKDKCPTCTELDA